MPSEALKPIAVPVLEIQRELFVRNVMKAYRAATDDQVARGKAWYPTARQLAEMVAGGDTVKGAGVIAALSANKSWSENVRLAHAACGGEFGGTFADSIDKARRILEGEAPTAVLPMALKTGHFFRCIADPTDADAVVIDRHAHDIAVNQVYGSADRGLSHKLRYALFAHVYREAAQRIGELPLSVQAVTWVAHIERAC